MNVAPSPSAQAGEALRTAIAALQAQRGVLGDAVVDAAVAPLQAQLAAMASPALAATPAVDELRLVTLLMLDVVGSTALSQRLDPEDIATVMDGALAGFAAIVRRHEGRVLEFAGDNLLAAFGLDTAREDEAERALHCALALRDRSTVLAAEVLARHGLAGFGVRVGVHTGPVLRSADGSAPVRGNTLLLVRRMEQTAPAGAVQISHDTWRHVPGRFEVRPLPPQTVPGRDAPQPCYEVLRAAARRPADWSVEGLHTRLLGREPELGQLLQTLAAVRDDGRARGLTLLADAGLGKTRLVHEFLQHVEAQGALPTLATRSQPAGRLQPYKLLHDALAGWCGVADSDSAAVARERIQATLAPLLGLAEREGLPWLLRLVGLADEGGDRPDPRALRDRGQAVFQAALAARAARGGTPLLWLADDLHWADEASLDLLQALLDSPLPLLLVATARPELLDRRPGWADAAAPRHRRLLLQPLPAAEGQALAAALLQRLYAPAPALAALLVQRAGGNPYFMEELLKMLVDDGVVTPGDAGWRLDIARLDAARLPSTLSGVLQARLDALSALQRQAVQQASIVGAVFWDQALAALSAQAPQALPALRARALVTPRPHSAFAGCSEDMFRHQLLQQAAYQTVPAGRRRAGHAAVARWLAARVSDRIGEHLATTAQHFLAADEPLTAAQWLARAADDAAQRFDNRSALAQVGQALDLLDLQQADHRPLALRLLQRGISAADVLGERDRQLAWVQQLEALAAGEGAPAEWAVHAGYSRAVVELRRDRHAAAAQAGLRTLALAQALGVDERGAAVCNILVVAARLQGDTASAREHARTGIGLARRAGLEAEELRLQANLGLVDFEAGDPFTARGALARAVALARPRPEQAGVLALMQANLAGCDCELADYEAAESGARAAVEGARQVGNQIGVGLSLQNLAEALLGLDRPDEARAPADEAVSVFLAASARLHAGFAALTAAATHRACGELERASASAQSAATWFDELQHPPGQRDAALQAAAIQAQQGQPGQRAAALRALESWLPLLQAQLKDPAAPGMSLARQAWLCHEVLACAEDPRAGLWRDHAHDLLQRLAHTLPDAAQRSRFLQRHALMRAIARAGAPAPDSPGQTG